MNFGNEWILFLKKADKNSGSSEEPMLCMQWRNPSQDQFSQLSLPED